MWGLCLHHWLGCCCLITAEQVIFEVEGGLMTNQRRETSSFLCHVKGITSFVKKKIKTQTLVGLNVNPYLKKSGLEVLSQV